MSVTDLGQAQGLAWARSAHSSFTGAPLAELQEWQGGKKAPAPAPKPVRLEATTGPGWKSSYGPGEKLSLEGLTLTIVYDDGSKKSSHWPFDGEEWLWHFNPDNGSEITVPTTLYCEFLQPEPYVYLSTQLELGYTGPIPVSLEATTGEGWKSSYGYGDILSLDGLILTIHYSDGSKRSSSYPFYSEFGGMWDVWPVDGSEITEPTTLQCSWEKGNIELRTQLELGYTDPVFKNMNFEGPARTTYTIGEKLSLDDLVVKAQWQQPDGSLEWKTVPEKLGGVTDGYTMEFDNNSFTSETLPTLTETGKYYLTIGYRGRLLSTAILVSGTTA